jgi:hypothetical protein
MSDQVAALLGGVKIATTNARGSNAEELADRAVDKIIYVGQNSDPIIVGQAMAFKEKIRAVLVHYLDVAQKAERDTICIKLQQQGHEDLANYVRNI